MSDETRSLTPSVASASQRPQPDPDATRIHAAAASVHATDPDATANGAPGPSSLPVTCAPPTHGLPSPFTLPGTATPGGPPIRQVGRYLIGERLGRGGMATVFKAHDPQIDRDVAIKFLHPDLCEDEDYHARFLREARAAGSLSHPNIVTVHDVGEIEGRPYMAMELLDGRPLADEMSGGKALGMREVVVMGIQLANALDYAHARGIVHRDIKPGNLLRVAGASTIKVTDFGIAHMDSAGAAHRTRVGDILGTPQYMSPEQTQGEKLDGRSDLFSTGILLYQMLTGQRPFLGDSLVTIAVRIAKEDPIPIERLRPELPASLRRIVARCLAKAPDRRFQTGQELADALGRVLVEIDEAERAKTRTRLVPLRVKWAGAMGLIVAVVMALTATIVYQRQYAAMLGQVIDSGSALARFIGAQTAAAVLGGEDWDSVDVAIKEVMRTGDFHDIAIVDRQGIVRAANDPARVGRAFVAPASTPLREAAEGLGTTVTRRVADDVAVLGFETPITFGGKRIGRVVLGLPEKPLVQVVRLSLVLMTTLVVVTVLAVAVAMYFVAEGFARPIRLVGESMDEIARGRFDQRIGEQRNDEFGELYAAFDRMAQALQEGRAGTGTADALQAPAAVAAAPARTATAPSAGGPGGPPASDRPAPERADDDERTAIFRPGAATPRDDPEDDDDAPTAIVRTAAPAGPRER